MSNLSLKQKIMIAVLALGAALIVIFQRGFYPLNPTPPLPPGESVNNESIKVVATVPTPLDEATILPTQTLEFTFNYPLENKGEFKHKFEPEFKDYDLKLSDDRKTVKITPLKPFKLGTTYTFAILPESKFDGKKVLKESFTYHFKTIEYRGV